MESPNTISENTQTLHDQRNGYASSFGKGAMSTTVKVIIALVVIVALFIVVKKFM